MAGETAGGGAAGSAWELQVAPMPDGVSLELSLADLGGAPVTARIVLDRGEARAFARALLAAAGDAAERTFPHPGGD